MKKIISLILPLALLLSLVQFNAYAYPVEHTEPESCSGTYYNIDWRYDSETKTIYFADNGSEEKAKQVVKPDFYQYESSDAAMWAEMDWRPGYPWYSNSNYIADFAEYVVFDESLTEILDYQCYKFTKITEVSVPDSVKRVGVSAFTGSSKLATINLPENLEVLESSALGGTAYYNNEDNWEDNVFYYRDYCLSHRTFKISSPVTVKDGTRVIAKGAFDFYRQPSITLPDSVEVIEEKAFYESLLESVDLPSSLITIGENAFAQSQLTEVTLPANVQSVAYNAFDKCRYFENIYVAPENEYLTSIDGILFSKSKKTLYIYPYSKQGEYYKTPAGVKTIYASFSANYYNQGYLKTLVISKDVNKVVNPIETSRVYYMGSLSRWEAISSGSKNAVNTCRVKQSKKKFTYSGKRKTPRVKVYGPTGKKLKKDRDYTITLPKGRRNVGFYTIVVTLKGKYRGKFEVIYKIAPRPTRIKKVKAGSTTADVSWGKQTKNITGYQIQYSQVKSFNYLSKLKIIKGKNKTKCTVKNLKMDYTYYVRVRTYKTVNGEKVFSKWSKAKRFKTELPI